MAFEPIAPYNGMEHVLQAAPCFVHPNGNMYGVACEKVGGITQNLSVYRTRPGSTHKELVKRYVGGVDSRAQIAAGGCVILQDGSLEVWCSAVPVTSAPVTKTGFSGVWDRIPHVDEPWSGGSGGVTLLPNVVTVPAWDARSLTTGELVDIPAVFGVPHAGAYLVRYSAVAPLANVRARAGTEQTPYMLTLCTQVANVEIHNQGWVPGPIVYLSPAQGVPVVWFQICGWSA